MPETRDHVAAKRVFTMGEIRRLQKLGKPRRAIVPTFRRIEVMATTPAGFVVHGPRGVHVVGLGVAELAELLTRLS